ncbi:cation:proton antiporter [Alteribacillus iranensis]|uniref:NhaP-type Na+/H+ or K+/H+ antiporter n=1 Tax=Alteribacillus iranensis TaxID=930128 RepID=A0A1I2FAZ2_9BACI|nr:sodium:proton antiporter [Alteribacillus iranensis]SFF02552.1 NhaP-type Na+/H+ or K+/H+ antiporter [Alteribacillus iranensis]
MFDSILTHLMLIGLLGIGSQWFAWRFRMPAIVVMSVAGLLIGPVLGIMNPQEDFGNLFNPVISVAVAIILFEGSLNLDFREIRGLGKSVFRIITLGAFIAWILGSLAAYYVAGLSWAVAFIIGGLFIVTGPTVILPLLRQAKLKPRPAAILKWEGIVVDPFGALLAVFAFEIITFITMDSVTAESLLLFFLASLFAVLIGVASGKVIGEMFERGYVPEFLKSPLVFAAVIGCFTVADEVMHETGLLAVTAMGMTMANVHTASLAEMRHFKENISVLLISGIFIMLTASLDRDTLMQVFDPNVIFYVILMLIVVRPISIWLSTINTELTFKEKALIGWIAPRGIVALTVAGYFENVLTESGHLDAPIVTPLTFALVFATVCAHGFTLAPIAKKLGLSLEGKPGVLIVGGSRFTTEFAKVLQELDIPVLLTDSSFEQLFSAKKAGVPYYRGEILSEQTEYYLDMTPYDKLIAATDRDSYNSLVATTFVPDFGRNNIFQFSWHVDEKDHPNDLVKRAEAQILFEKGATYEELNQRVNEGYVFRKTKLTKQYTFEQYSKEREKGNIILFVLKQSGKLNFVTTSFTIKPEPGDTIVSLSPTGKEKKKIEEKLLSQRKEQREQK